MEQSKIGDFENFIIMATKTSGLSTSYSTFLDYKTVRTFLKKIASTPDNDTFLYEKTIYNKKITSADANNILTKLDRNVFDSRLKLLATQLNLRLR
jgi:hypothetical protein|tara:strand:+ start:197 stop:484 length:288 start_codon:yes stop_codon:yes gene_type:complete